MEQRTRTWGEKHLADFEARNNKLGEMASNLIPMASNLEAMPSNLIEPVYISGISNQMSTEISAPTIEQRGLH